MNKTAKVANPRYLIVFDIFLYLLLYGIFQDPGLTNLFPPPHESNDPNDPNLNKCELKFFIIFCSCEMVPPISLIWMKGKGVPIP